MNERFIIHGGKELEGIVQIRGSKNTALPLIAACFLSEETSVLENVPTIADVGVMVEIAVKMGASVAWEKEAHRLTVNAKDLSGDTPDEDLSRKLRGSVLFAGALLGRSRRAVLPYPGGDAIGARPLGVHLRAFESLGVRVSESRFIELDGAQMCGGPVVMEEPSVTATENVILAAVRAPGKTVVSLGAIEPHVQELVLFLNAMGADIQWTPFGRININGGKKLRGARACINPDELEISGFAALAAATRSELVLKSIQPEYLEAVFLHLGKMGVVFDVEGDTLRIRKPAVGYRGFRLQSGLYPKLGSDHIPPFAVLATQADGTSLIHDWLYEHRLRYLKELTKMGASCEVLDPHRARITGPTPLYGCTIESLDIRSGMTLIIAALVASGESKIAEVSHIDRGYEALDARLRDLGADIERVAS